MHIICREEICCEMLDYIWILEFSKNMLVKQLIFDLNKYPSNGIDFIPYY